MISEYRGQIIFNCLDGVTLIRDVTIDLHGHTHLPDKLMYEDRYFIFSKVANEPQERPVYDEVHEDKVKELIDPEYTIDDYVEMHIYHEELIKELAQQIQVLQNYSTDIRSIVREAMDRVDMKREDENK